MLVAWRCLSFLVSSKRCAAENTKNTNTTLTLGIYLVSTSQEVTSPRIHTLTHPPLNKTLLYGNYQGRRSPTRLNTRREGKDTRNTSLQAYNEYKTLTLASLLGFDPPLDLESFQDPSRTGDLSFVSAVEELARDLE